MKNLFVEKVMNLESESLCHKVLFLLILFLSVNHESYEFDIVFLGYDYNPPWEVSISLHAFCCVYFCGRIMKD